MPAPTTYRLVVLACLVATTAVNAAFLLADPRLFALPLWLAAVFLAGGAAYGVAAVLCAKRRREGFVLAAMLGALGGAVAAADDLSLSGSTPNAPTFVLNFAVLVLQVPLVLASVLWLRARGDAA